MVQLGRLRRPTTHAGSTSSLSRAPRRRGRSVVPVRGERRRGRLLPPSRRRAAAAERRHRDDVRAADAARAHPDERPLPADPPFHGVRGGRRTTGRSPSPTDVAERIVTLPLLPAHARARGRRPRRRRSWPPRGRTGGRRHGFGCPIGGFGRNNEITASGTWEMLAVFAVGYEGGQATRLSTWRRRRFGRHGAACAGSQRSQSGARRALRSCRRGSRRASSSAGSSSRPSIAFSPDGRGLRRGEEAGTIKVFDSLTDPTPTIYADLRTQRPRL